MTPEQGSKRETTHYQDSPSRAIMPRFAVPEAVICGTGSWVEGHRVPRLGQVRGNPNPQGTGITGWRFMDN